MIIHLIAGLIKMKLINVKFDLSNYVKKTDLKNVTGIDTSKLAAKSDLVSLKAKVDKLDIDKLPTNLSNLKSKVNKLNIRKVETFQLI